MDKGTEEFELTAKKARENQSPQDIIDVIPYGAFIGISAEVLDGNVLYTFCLLYTSPSPRDED